MRKLLILCLLFSGCTSNAPPPQKLGIVPVSQGGTLGWSGEKNNLTFNAGEPKWDFKNSPIGKLTYGVADIFYTPPKEER